MIATYQGDNVIAPPGLGNPASRIAIRSANVRPPPAESPAMTIFFGSMGLDSPSFGGSIRYK